MKYLLALSIWAASPGCSPAQGLVNFYNNATTLISDNPTGTFLPIDGKIGNYEFALLSSPVGSDMFSFAGIYATNTTTPGMFTGGAGISVPGWAAGTQRDFVVYGWRASVGGVTYNPSWLNPNLSPGPNSPPAFGLSDVSTGVAGGVGGSGTVPALDLFGPGGIQTGFLINGQLPAPEPSSAALLGLGAAVLLVQSHRRRRRVAVSNPLGRPTL